MRLCVIKFNIDLFINIYNMGTIKSSTKYHLFSVLLALCGICYFMKWKFNLNIYHHDAHLTILL